MLAKCYLCRPKNADVCRKMLSKLRRLDSFAVFEAPVDPYQFPDYHRRVLRAVCARDIAERLDKAGKRFRSEEPLTEHELKAHMGDMYISVGEFFADVNQVQRCPQRADASHPL